MPNMSFKFFLSICLSFCMFRMNSRTTKGICLKLSMEVDYVPTQLIGYFVIDIKAGRASKGSKTSPK